MAKSLSSIKAQLAKIEEQKKALIMAERTAHREAVYSIGKLVTGNPSYLSHIGMAAVKKLFADSGAIMQEILPAFKPDSKPESKQPPASND